jgi:hypothetical protein
LAGAGCITAARPQAATALASKFVFIFTSHLFVNCETEFSRFPRCGAVKPFLSEY